MPHISDPALLIIYALALASVTALVTGADTLTERANDWIVARFEAIADWSIDFFDNTPASAGWFAIKLVRGICWFFSKMISCMWCASFWLACFMLWGAEHWRHPAMLFIASALALRQFVGMTSSLGR